MSPQRPKSGIELSGMTDEHLILLRGRLEAEMRRRKIAFSVGDVGEKLVIAHFNSTPGLPKLQLAPAGTKNVDALSRDGERFSIKTIWNAKKTGTVYPDSDEPDKQLFEHLIVARLNDNWSLASIHKFSWQDFINMRSWDKRMNAWYLPCTTKSLSPKFAVYKAQELQDRNGFC